MYSGEAINEVVLENLDGALGGVDAVFIGLHKFQINILGVNIVCTYLEHSLSVTFRCGVNTLAVK